MVSLRFLDKARQPANTYQVQTVDKAMIEGQFVQPKASLAGLLPDGSKYTLPLSRLKSMERILPPDAEPREEATNADVVILKNGDRVSGTIRTEDFVMETPHGSLAFKKDDLERIVLKSGAQPADLAMLRNGDRVSGKLTTASIQVELPKGAGAAQFDKDKIQEVIFAKRPWAYRPFARAPFVDMVVTSVDVGCRKLNPAGLLCLAHELSVGADAMLYVGDERKDIEAATRAGMRQYLS
jgi:hypothetical protein